MIDNPSSEKLKQEQKERIEAYAEHLAGHVLFYLKRISAFHYGTAE